MIRATIHEVFAQILGVEVKNIIVCENYATANYLTKQTYGETAFAVDCTQYPITIGDKYHDNKFWKVDSATGEETEIIPIPTEEAQVSKNKYDISLVRGFATELFELLPSLVSTSSLVFTEDSIIVEMYGEAYVKANYDVTIIPNIGNLFSVILSIFGTSPAAE